MSKKSEQLIVRHMASSKGLSSSSALIMIQKQKNKAPEDSIMATGIQ